MTEHTCSPINTTTTAAAAPIGVGPSNMATGRRQVSLTEAEVVTLSDGHQHCLVCYGDLTHRGKLPCGHDDICGVCHLRLRFLHDDRKCPICKNLNETVVVDHDPNKGHDDYPRWGDEMGAGFVYRSDVGMFFREEYYQGTVTPLFAHECSRCDYKVDETTHNNANKKNTPRRLLEDHLRTAHRLALCHLCIDHKRDFISRLPRMTPNQLQTHLKKGDGPTSGFNGHPICEFCRPKRFYDLNNLHQHLHQEHYKCHVCEKRGQDNQWFKNYGSLERHFDKVHFLCHDVQCLGARFVVFDNELDFRAHELSVHGGTSTGSTKINLEFQTRRRGYDGSGVDNNPQGPPSEADFNYDLDGQAFVPEALPTQGSNIATTGNNNLPHHRTNPMASSSSTPSGGDSHLHPLHVQRTEEMRAHAATIRQEQARQAQVDSFPTLRSANAPTSSSAPLVGWTTGTALQKVNKANPRVGRTSQEAFPALPSATTTGNNSKMKALNIGGTRVQFAAMTAAASQTQAGQPSWGGGGAGAGRGTNSASAAAVTLTPLTSASTAARSSPSNQQSNLAADNFPELGPSSVRSAKKNRSGAAMNAAAPPSFRNVAEFPSLGSSTGGATNGATRTVAQTKAPPQQQPPSLASSLDFPPPPSAHPSSQAGMRQQLVQNDSKVPPRQVSDNVLQADLSASTSAKATVEDMKATMGPAKFKQLKRLTKDFTEGLLSPEGYVDQSAALFENGYDDDDFWSYLPSLLESCPNEGGSLDALRYMTSLRRQQFSQDSRSTRSTTMMAAGPPSQWGGSTANNANVMRQIHATASASAPAPAFTAFVAATPLAQSALAPVRPAHSVASKKKNAWGTGGNATIVRMNAPPSAVSAAAAMEGPQGGTATKFMAKEKKQMQAKNSQQQKQPNGKKKKEKEELRALAFGR